MAETAVKAYAVKSDNTADTAPTSIAGFVDATGFEQLVAVSDGSGTPGNVVGGDSGNNAQVVTGARKEVTFSTASAAAVASTDVSNYRWVSVQITSSGTGSATTFQGSNDNTNWVTVSLQAVGAASGSGVTSAVGVSTGMWAGPCQFRYFRLNITGISAGTTAGVCEFFSQSPSAATAYLSTVAITGTPAIAPGSGTTGLTQFFAAAQSNAATAVKTSTGRLYNYNVYNPNASVAFLQVWDLAVGSVTVGTTAPKASYAIPAGGVWDGGLIYSLGFATAITIAATTTATGATAPGTGLVVNLGYA